MSRYNRGADFERKLLTAFWDKGYAAVRAAGSGTRAEPVPDIIAAKDGHLIIVECKTTRGDRLSLKAATLQLERFAKVSGGDAYIAIRFLRKRPRFYPLPWIMGKGSFTIRDTDECMGLDTVCGRQSTL